MESQLHDAGEPPVGEDEGVPATRTARTRLMGAGAAAVLALAVFAFPGDWTALWSSRQAVDTAAVAMERDAAGALYADLERHLRWEPSDTRAWVFKARLDMRAARYDLAAVAYQKALAGNAKMAKDPDVWVEYAEARGMAQGRTLVGEPLELVHKALELNGDHPQALDLAGSAAWEMRNFTEAAAYWKRLLKQLPEGTTRHAELLEAIERAQRRAKVSLPPPASAS
jgi:cytochrome c-type biogenesis protein CcmH